MAVVESFMVVATSLRSSVWVLAQTTRLLVSDTGSAGASVVGGVTGAGSGAGATIGAGAGAGEGVAVAGDCTVTSG
jgi:hypothetical protein